MGTLIEDPRLRNRTAVFPDREEAGRRLAAHLAKYAHTQTIILAIPSGGVPVGAQIARILEVPFDLIIVRKLQIPWNPEAGFGAANSAGEVVLNEGLVRDLGLRSEDIEQAKRKSLISIRSREEAFRKGRRMISPAGRNVILVDDGLASGFTMRAAVMMAKRDNPLKVVVAVPTGSIDTVKSLLPEVDELVCLNIRGPGPFAVADAYANWYDLTDEDVLATLAMFA